MINIIVLFEYKLKIFGYIIKKCVECLSVKVLGNGRERLVMFDPGTNCTESKWCK